MGLVYERYDLVGSPDRKRLVPGMGAGHCRAAQRDDVGAHTGLHRAVNYLDKTPYIVLSTEIVYTHLSREQLAEVRVNWGVSH